MILTVSAITNARKLSHNPTHLRRRLLDTITFDDPTHHGKLVDWCLSFQTDCGKPAADAYCTMNGYGEATKYPKRRTYGDETLTMKQLSTCSPAHNVCDTFDYITCQVNEQTFENPMEHNRVLDGCYKFDSGCGKAAAYAYCKDKGFSRAKEYSQIESKEETMSIGDHAVCDPAWHRCNTFSYITCVASPGDTMDGSS